MYSQFFRDLTIWSKRESHHRPAIQSVGLLTGLALCLLTAPAVAAEKLDYNRDVRPILSNKCFRCHGFDDKNRAAGLRLDMAEGALAERDGAAAIVPHAPEKSLLVERIETSDVDLKMPPPESPQQLTEQEIALLKQWIREGAEYQPHWAFAPLSKPEIPLSIVTPVDTVPGSPLDGFIEKDLLAKGIPVAPMASRAVRIRRLYLDVLGILPSPEEIDRFEQDAAPDAWEKLVDQVLASPHYGERWGRHWLDQARYADSNGYTIDGARVMWPYRDWVIQALNADMPFDQFTIEQLAGDLLPNASKKQLVATAFHRNTMINEEGGVKADQFRHEAMVDRVATTGSVWLGLSIGCAQCHTHKYDPITHEDFHRLYAFFNAAKDANNQADTVPVYVNEVFGLTPAQQALLAQLKALRIEQGKLKEAVGKESKAASGGDPASVRWNRVEFKQFAAGSNGELVQLPDQSLLASRKFAENDNYEVTFDWPEKTRAVKIVVLTHESLPRQGPGLASNGNFVLSDVSLKQRERSFRFEQAFADHEQPGYTASHAIDSDPQSGWAINVSADQTKRNPQLKMNARHELVLKASQEVEPGPVTIVLRHDRNAHYLIGRFAVEVADQWPEATSPSSQIQQQLAEINEQIRRLEAQVPGAGREYLQMVMQDLPKPPPTYLLLRGDFLNPDLPRGELFPGVPAALTVSIGPADKPKNRLDLARWLVSKDNALTARVFVNRVWMRYFGRGIVETENDFGMQGSLPFSPELLDWLAGRFIEKKWSMKSLHKEILLSKTYCRESRVTSLALSKDPQNRALGRQQRLRVDAEIVRDLMLSASGLLTPTIGGPSVFPPQPAGVFQFTQNSKPWNEEQGENRYRRTMYTMFYRSAPYPLLATFDAPDFTSACTRRQPSSTPLQALSVANDPMFLEVAGGLAQRVLQDQPRDPEAIANAMWKICLSRAINADEREIVAKFFEAEKQRFDRSPEQINKLLKPMKRFSWPADLSQAEIAATISLARLVFNTDEFITRN